MTPHTHTSGQHPHKQTHTSFTILGLKVGEAELGAGAGDEDFSIQGEDHGLVLHVDHTAHHVSRVPAAAKQAAAHVQTLALGFQKQTHAAAAAAAALPERRSKLREQPYISCKL